MQFVETTPEFWDSGHRDQPARPSEPAPMRSVPLMIDAGGGRVINIASDAGRVGSSGESVYSACKGGIIAFRSKTLARETARKDARVNVVCPLTDTALLRLVHGRG